MIRIEELRLGNWVEHNGEIIQVKPYHFEVFMNPESQPANPIPLTEEILLKCGFKKCGYELLFWEHDKISFKFFGINWADADKPEYQFLNFEYGEAKLYYLHQLQNLYFALTGEELNIEL